MKTPLLTLSAEQIQHLTELTSRDTVAVKTYRRAMALLALHQGQSYSAVGRQLGVRYDTVAEWAKQFTASGLAMLTDKPRSGRPLTITGSERAALTALASRLKAPRLIENPPPYRSGAALRGPEHLRVAIDGIL